MDSFVPKDRARCWVAEPTSMSMVGKVTFFETGEWHAEMLKRGLLFSTRKAAVAASEQMLAHVLNAKVNKLRLALARACGDICYCGIRSEDRP